MQEKHKGKGGVEKEYINVPTVIDSATVSRVRIAPSGKPFAMGLAIVTMSGWQSTGRVECPHSVPERYSPH